MINPDYQVTEIETLFFEYLKKEVGDFDVIESLSQIRGGNEAYLYRFHVKGISGMDKPQVLRLFPSFYGKEKANWEAMIQNLLYERGVPVPRAFLSSQDMDILGGSFLVMDFVEGETIDPGDDPEVLKLAARTQAKLHELDGKPISNAIRALGHSEISHSITGRLNWLLDRAKKYPQLSEIFSWVVDNMPSLPEKLSVVHGDFHAMNLLIDEGEVVAILDWSGFIIGDPMAGLGWTLGITLATVPNNVPKVLINDLIQNYLTEYGTYMPIDNERLNYFVVFRLAMALVEGLDGQEWWTQPYIVQNILNEVESRTGINVKRQTY
jgi:aminoglycoside phosphotransferase (APT) family kinase protein